ncbi:MAG TPA: DUF3606 domain-containing protein [Mucilaginibacter sp.]|jgi:hypothetical protein
MENKSQIETPDNKRTGVEKDQELELDYWSNEFGISKDELMEVVKAGGTSAQAVEQYVKKISLRSNTAYAL